MTVQFQYLVDGTELAFTKYAYSLVEKVIGELLLDLAEQTQDAKRKVQIGRPKVEIWMVARSCKGVSAMHIL
jgi:hypothetical protein